MHSDNSNQKLSTKSIMLLSLILIISVSMFSSPALSSLMYSLPSPSSQLRLQQAFAQNGEDNGESDSSSESDNPVSTDATNSAPPQTSSDSTASAATDPSLSPSPITTIPPTLQIPATLTDNDDNSSSSSTNDNNGEQELDCDDVSERDFIVSSGDPNGFDEDNDGIGCESDDGNSNGNVTTPTPEANEEGPDGDCLFNPDLPKCASVDGECPDGFFQNEDEQCVPDHRDGCPDGYHSVDDDETGRCIPNSDGCPAGMIFRPDQKTCGYKDDICKQNPGLDDCVETPDECDNNRDDDSDGLTDSEDPDCGQQQCDPSYPDNCISSPPPDLDCDQGGDLEDDEIPYHNFKVNGTDPHGFDGNDNDGIGCETGSDDDNGNNGDSDVIRASQDACDDISDTINLYPGQLDSERVQIIAYFEDCELDLASLTLNIVEDDDLKLVAANFEEGVSDAVEVELELKDTQDSNSSNSLYEATISGTQEGLDLETGDSKTINNVNGVVLWNDGDDPIQFAENNSVDFDIEFD
jgi:hypothetical protein